MRSEFIPLAATGSADLDELVPWAAIVIAVPFGWMAFDSLAAWEAWQANAKSVD